MTNNTPIPKEQLLRVGALIALGIGLLSYIIWYFYQTQTAQRTSQKTFEELLTAPNSKSILPADAQKKYSETLSAPSPSKLTPDDENKLLQLLQIKTN